MSRQSVLLIVVFFVFINGPVFSVQPLKWISADTTSFPVIPVQKGIAGAFTGVSNNVLLMAGGMYFDSLITEGGKDIYLDSIFICRKLNENYQWEYAGRLPHPVAHGASVTFNAGVLCLGGENNHHKFNDVFLLRWDPSTETVLIENDFPALPIPTSYLSAAVNNKTVYVAGGKVGSGGEGYISDYFLKLEPRHSASGEWRYLDPWPGPARFGASLVSQSDGKSSCLFLMGGMSGDVYLSDAYIFDPGYEGKSDQWKKLTDMPYGIAGASALPVGGSRIFMFGGNDIGNDEESGEITDTLRHRTEILSYNTITGVWHKTGELPQGVLNANAIFWDGLIVIPGGRLSQGKCTPRVIALKINSAREGNFSALDYSMLFIYLSLIAWLGYYFSSKNKSSNDFFLGGQKIPFWAAGLSMMAAQVSSIGFMAIPAKSFATNWSYFAGVFTWFIAVPVVIYAFVPFYRRLNVTSAYEYLDKRFNSFIRIFIATLYLLFQLTGRLGAIIFLPAIALSAVTGMNAVTCILIIGCLATAYTVLGGMHAVIWIDVIQALVLFGGIIVIIIYIMFNLDGGVNEFMQVAWNDNKFSFGSMDINLTTAVLWVIIIGNIFNRLGTMSTDQSVVQRYLTTRDERETAKALWTDVAVSIPWALFVFGLGTALYVFYKANPHLIDPTLANDEIVPFFIGQNLPAGISGIIIAGIFAASMSSVDSSIHSSTTVIMRDFLHRKVGSKTELRKVALARWITGGIGLMGTSIALVMTFFDINSVWDIVLELAGLFTGAMTGVFILGIFSTRANGKGAVAGALASALVLLLVKNNTSLHFFLYSGVGILSCIIIGYLASFFFKDEKQLNGLTIYTINK